MSPNINEELTKIPREEEIKKAVFGLKADSAPGTDGYTALFFQSCWNIISSDMVESVCEFFQGGEMPLGFSHTLLALVPKKDKCC